MTTHQIVLYVVAVMFALAFIQGLLPESPLGFVVWSLSAPLFASPVLGWRSWPYVLAGAAVGGVLYHLRQRRRLD